MKNKKYYISVDYIRVLACIAVFLYHLNLLKGGYLAVCLFFVISGYFACTSSFQEEKFSLLSYYRHKIFKIYLPLLLFVFITIFAVSFFENVYWPNLRPETTSVLLGYNNYWQLQANLDYFTKQLNSPFIHLWYISIILQFYLLFPFLFMALKKIGDKVKKIIPCLITLFLAIGFSVYFYINSIDGNMMNTYYGTFSRVFSLLFGLCLGFIHSYYKPLIIKKKNYSKLIMFLYILILILLFIFIDSSSPYFAISMIIVTLITCRLLDYATVKEKDNLSILDKIIKSLASVSYLIYLFQYPIIFLFQYIKIDYTLKLILIILITLLLSYLLKFSLNFKRKSKVNILRFFFSLVFLSISFMGIYHFDKAKEITRQIQELEVQLEKNEVLMQEKQKEYAEKLKEEEEKLTSSLEEINSILNNLDNTVKELPIVGIGDSVMLGALPNLYNLFSNGYFDAKISRTAWVVENMLEELNQKNMLGNPIILHLGTNGDCSTACKLDILKASGNREIFWINVTNDQTVKVNDKLQNFAKEHENVHIIDWEGASLGHSEYFYADKIHLTETGKKAYTQTIYNAIYNFYLEKYTKEKNKLIAEFEENKITFYSDELLVNITDELEENLTNSQFIFDQELNDEKLKIKIEEGLKKHSLGKRIVLAFDNTQLTKEEYQELINLLQDRQVYILVVKKEDYDLLKDLNKENVKIINFYDTLKENEEYLLFDKVHLSEKGYLEISKTLINILNNDE